MNSDLDIFNPATWHDRGLLRPPPTTKRRPRSQKTHVRRPINKVVAGTFAATAVALFTTSMTLFEFPLASTSEAHAAQASLFSTSVTADPYAAGPTSLDSDYIDPSTWSTLATLLARLPRDETPEPDGPPPLV
jgi:hypothetical protein